MIFSTVENYNNFSKESNTTKIYQGYSFTDTDKTLIDNILLIKNRNKEYLSFKKKVMI